MYYAHFILNKKGPLAKIWLAAHWDKKLTKAQIYETNIESTIETILEPQMKLALRTSGHLLLGVCRIYSRKVKYLLADCNEAFVKIKLAFRPGLIDLPKEKQQANVEAITLPEKFPEFSLTFTDLNMEDMDLSKNLTQQARVEDITLKEDFGTFVTMQDDDFGDMGSFGMDMESLMMSDMERGRRDAGNSISGFGANDQNDLDFFDDRLGNNHSAFANGLGDLSSKVNNDLSIDRALGDSNIMNKIDEYGTSNLENPMAPDDINDETMIHEMDNNEITNIMATGAVVPALFEDQPTVNVNHDEPATKLARTEQELENGDVVVEAENLKKAEKQIRSRRRRNKLIIDDIKEIDSAAMKSQLNDTSSILGTLELAPPTRKLMQLKETGGVDRLFAMTCRPLHSKLLSKFYVQNMTTKSLQDITNSLKLSEKQKKDSSYLSAEIEANLNDQHLSKLDVLPSADSFIDQQQDGSKRNESAFDNQDNQFNDDFDQFPPPASIFNTNANLEDMLLDDLNPAQLNLEITPNKELTKNNKKSNGQDQSEDDEEEEEEDGENRKSKSPKRRSYKRSMNNKENSTLNKEEEGDELEDTLLNDPSKNLTKRARTMVSVLSKSFAKHDNVGFFELIKRNGRKMAAQKFYSLLVLKKYEIIEVTQDETYSDIIISQGDKFDSFSPSN